MAWRLFGPELPPRFHGAQERPLRLAGRTVVVGQQEFFVREAGPQDGPPLILLHGWVYDSLATWHRVLPLLTDGHRVTAVDARNHGKSDRIRGGFEIETLADEVAAVFDALGVGRVPVVGYSMGGMVAQALAHRHPGRVEKLVLGATAAYPISRRRMLVWAGFLLGRALSRFTGLELRRAVYSYLLRSGAVDRRHGRWLWDVLTDRDSNLYYEGGFAILRFDSRKWVGGLEVPALVIVPTEDQLIRAEDQYDLADRLPDARLVELVGAKHEAVLTHAEDLAKAIQEFVA